MIYAVRARVWYHVWFGEKSLGWHAAIVDEAIGNRYHIRVLTADGRVVPAVGVPENQLRPSSCFVSPMVNYESFDILDKFDDDDPVDSHRARMH